MAVLCLPSAHAQEESSETTTSAATTTGTASATAPASSLASRAALIEQKSKRALVRWKVGLDYASFGNETDQAQTTGFAMNGVLHYRLVKMLELKASTTVGLASGYAQSRFGEFTPSNGVNLKEALIRFRPVREFSLSAGAISQEYLNSPLLISAGPFLGGIEKLAVGDIKILKAELIAQQSVPASSQLTTKAVESEPTPSFFVETLELRTKVIPHLELFTSGGHFAFRDLPSSVAFESAAFGNQVIGETAGNSRFAFPFQGWLAGGGTRIQFVDSFGMTVQGQMMQNTEAPENFRNGQWVEGKFHILLPGEILLEPAGAAFFAESDLAPAYYNSASLGHTNRQGWQTGLDTTFKQAGFKIGAHYVDADVINPTPYQTRQQYFKIVFETLYEML
jgi:hypothetical protein